MKKTIISLIAGAAVAVSLSGCSGYTSADQANAQDRSNSGAILSHFQKAQPAPQFDYSQIRQTLIDAESAQANTTQTTTFFFNQGVQDPVFICPSIGFPVAGTSQITNPSQVTDGNGSYGTGSGNVTIEQIDPNGIYSGNTSATFVLCVNAQGKVYLHHAEEFAHAVAGPAEWDYGHHIIHITGDPTFAPKVGKK